MARPKKTGLSYFPLDIDFFDDPKVEFISAKYGLIAEAILLRLLSRIYRNGYYIEWDEDSVLLFAKKLGITVEFVNGIIDEALKRNFFDKNLYDKYKILTSPGIQKRYDKICHDAKRKDFSILDCYCLLKKSNKENLNYMENSLEESQIISSEINKLGVNDDYRSNKQSFIQENCTQTKIEQITENEIIKYNNKVEGNKDSLVSKNHFIPSLDEIIEFIKINHEISIKNAEDIAKVYLAHRKKNQVEFNKETLCDKNGRLIIDWESDITLWMEREGEYQKKLSNNKGDNINEQLKKIQEVSGYKS